MKKKKISHVCIVDTVYTLMFYYLNYSVEEIDNTFFFVSTGIPRSERERLPQHHFFKKKNSILQRFLFRFNLRVFSRLRWSFLKSKPIYGSDHLTFSSGIIGNRKYTLLEDGPYTASYHFDYNYYQEVLKQRSSKIRNFFVDMLCGRVFLRPYGDNSQCEHIIFSAEDMHPVLLGKDIQVNPLDKLWEEASVEKKEKIMRLFDITDNDITFLNSKPIILLTQTFFKDNVISEEEQVQIYDKIIKQYPTKDIILKPHPRDPINYSYYFPDIAIFEKILPNQLLDLLDVRFKKAVTVTSSSVLSFPYKIEIDWIGTKIHPKLIDALGDIKMPNT
jgi:Glycosyltransferase family 52.